jgi:hypothetical protein
VSSDIFAHGKDLTGGGVKEGRRVKAPGLFKYLLRSTKSLG